VNVNSRSHVRRPTRKLRTQVRREQIAQAALALISRRGLNELNISALAREVRVVPSAIYRHYARKDAVLESVLDLIGKSLLENVEAARDETSDSLGRLHLLLQRQIRLVRHHAGMSRVIFSEQIFAGSPHRRQQIHKIMSSYLTEIAGIIAEGQKAGEIRPDICADSVAVMFLGLIQSPLILWLMSNRTFDVAQHTEQAWGLFCEILEEQQRLQTELSAPEMARHRFTSGRALRTSKSNL
jgi:AcrR family transcriptional regulator